MIYRDQEGTFMERHKLVILDDAFGLKIEFAAVFPFGDMSFKHEGDDGFRPSDAGESFRRLVLFPIER